MIVSRNSRAFSIVFFGVIFSICLLLGRAIGISGELYQRLLAMHAFSLILSWPLFASWLIFTPSENMSKAEDTFEFLLWIFWAAICACFFFSGNLIPSKYLILPWSDSNGFLLVLFFLLAFTRNCIGFYRSKNFCIKCLYTLGTLLYLHSTALCIYCLLNPGILYQNPKLQEIFWLGAGHLIVQTLTILTFLSWGYSLGVDLLKTPARFIFQLYLFFVAGSVLSTLLPYPGSAMSVIPWSSEMVLIPALGSFLICAYILAIFFQRGKAVLSRENLPLLISFFSFTIWGAITGLTIYHSLIYRTLSQKTLLMPGHFHPFVAAASSTSIFLLFQPKNSKMRKPYFDALSAFGFGVLILSIGFSWAGFLQWPRRVPWSDPNYSLPLITMVIGGVTAFSSICLVLALLFSGSERIKISPSVGPNKKSYLKCAIALSFWFFLLWLYQRRY